MFDTNNPTSDSPNPAQLPQEVSTKNIFESTGVDPSTFSATNYHCVLALRGHTNSISSLCFSPCGRYLASASVDLTVRIWDISSGELVGTAHSIHRLGLTCVRWSPNGQFLAVASDDSYISLWTVTKVESSNHLSCLPFRILRGHTNYVSSLAFSPQSNILISGSFDESICIWDILSGACVRQIDAHSEPVVSVDFSSCGTTFCSASLDGVSRIWDLRTGQCLATIFSDISSPATCIRFSPNGRFVMTSYLDSSIRIWDISTGKYRKEYSNHSCSKHLSTFFVFPPKENSMELYTNRVENRQPDEAHNSTSVDPVYQPRTYDNVSGVLLDVSSVLSNGPDTFRSPILITSSEDGHVYVYDVESMKLLRKVPVNVVHATTSPTTDLVSQSTPKELTPHSRVVDMAFHPQKNMFATVSNGIDKQGLSDNTADLNSLSKSPIIRIWTC